MTIDYVNLGIFMVGILSFYTSIIMSMNKKFEIFEKKIFIRANEKYPSKDKISQLCTDIELIKKDIELVLDKIDNLSKI